MCPLGKVVSRILCLNANLSRTSVARRLKRGMPRPALEPCGFGTIPLAPRGVCQLSVRYRTGPSVAPCGTSNGFSRFGRSPVWSLWHFPYPALMYWQPGRRRYLPRFPGSVRTFLTRVAPSVRVPLSERAGALYGKRAIWQIGALPLGECRIEYRKNPLLFGYGVDLAQIRLCGAYVLRSPLRTLCRIFRLYWPFFRNRQHSVDGGPLDSSQRQLRRRELQIVEFFVFERERGNRRRVAVGEPSCQRRRLIADRCRERRKRSRNFFVRQRLSYETVPRENFPGRGKRRRFRNRPVRQDYGNGTQSHQLAV